MRVVVLHLRPARTFDESCQVASAAIRQLERAQIYFDAVSAMEFNDWNARRALARLQSDTEALRRYLDAKRSALRR